MVTESLSVLPGLQLEALDAGNYLVTGAGKHFALQALAPAVAAGLEQLFSAGASKQALDLIVTREGGVGASLQFDYILEQFLQQGFICRTFELDGRPLLQIVPTGRAAPECVEVVEEGRFRLSRFTLLRREDAGLVVESPLAHSRLYSADPRVIGWLAGLAATLSWDEQAALLPELDRSSLGRLLGVLLASSLVEDATLEESPERRGWEVHDLYFHASSRLGRSGNGYGSTYRMESLLPPQPLLKPAAGNPIVSLPKPDLERLQQEDRPFSAALQARRSLRMQGEVPISLNQLGEFLYRVGREREVRSDERGETGNRPYPTGGALYELELYLAVNRCQDLEPGLYHYRPLQHELSLIASPNPLVQALSAAAGAAIRSAEPPQVLLVMTARFGRVNWKYQSLAYALILKDVGVVMQTMYLVATAMDLAPCAIGGGDSDLFAQAAELNYLSEGSVGEFALGSIQHS